MSKSKQKKSGSLWRIAIGISLLAIAIIGIALLARPQGRNGSTQGGLNVVAAENFWGDIAAQLGGSHVHVTSIITDPSADPHLYESNAQNAAAVASANVVIVNGLGYDDFMGKLLEASKSGRDVLRVADVLGITDQGVNQHLWYDIPKVSKVASKITASFEAQDPTNKVDYERSLASFEQSLDPLLQTISRIKKQYAGAPVAYTEPVPGYLLQAAGLNVKTPEGFAKSIEDGDDPSPADAQAMDDLVTTKAIRTLLYNSQATSPVTEHVKDAAKQAGIPVIGVSETLPQGEKNYQAWQQDQLDQLLKALETK